MTRSTFLTKTLFLLLSFLFVVEKSVASSTCSLFDEELNALCTAKSTFTQTLDVKDLQHLVAAANHLTSTMTEHFSTYRAIPEEEEPYTVIEYNALLVGERIASAFYRYEVKANTLTQDDPQARTLALKKAEYIYNERRACSLLVERLEATRNFYYTTFQSAQTARSPDAWQVFDHVHTCLNELSAMYWTGELSLIEAILTKQDAFQPLWGYWNDDGSAATQRQNLFHLTRVNALGYLFSDAQKEQPHP